MNTRAVSSLFLLVFLCKSVGAEPFAIEVVDEQTGRGVPLVELTTTGGITYVTDSAGLVAFDEPELLGRRVHFAVQSHGYEFRKDGFGFGAWRWRRSPAVRRSSRSSGSTSPSGSIASPVRGSIATACCSAASRRCQQPLLNAQVVGSDSVVNAVYRGKTPLVLGRHAAGEISARHVSRSRRDQQAAGRGRPRSRAGRRSGILHGRQAASPARPRKCRATDRRGSTA